MLEVVTFAGVGSSFTTVLRVTILSLFLSGGYMYTTCSGFTKPSSGVLLYESLLHYILCGNFL
jgi:hypothetical protein